MIYECATENSTDDKDAIRTLGMRFVVCGSPVDTCAVKTPQDMPGLHRDVQGYPKYTPGGFTDLAETRECGLRIKSFLVDVSL